jgi:MSHA biogenesis protein MshO
MRGVTLIEMVVALVVLAVVGAILFYFFLPARQAIDVATRADLTDVADNALQRISREVRLALPNSVRVTASGGSVYLEFLPVVTAGRYRSDGGGASGGTDCPATGTLGQPDSDQLSFGAGDTCFKSVGPLLNGGTVTSNDFVVLSNFGLGFANQNAYLDATTNLRRITATAVEATPPRQRLQIEAPAAPADDFSATLHDSPGKRFYVVAGNGTTLLPVTYECTNTGTLVRRSGYPRTEIQASSFAGATTALLAAGVTQCAFDYVANVSPQIGLLTLQLTLSVTFPQNPPRTESVTLYQSVHVVNVP